MIEGDEGDLLHPIAKLIYDKILNNEKCNKEIDCKKDFEYLIVQIA